MFISQMHGADAVFKIYQEHCPMCTAHVIFTVCTKEFQFRAFSFGQSYSAHRAKCQPAAAFQTIWCRSSKITWCRSTKSTWCTSTATAGEEGAGLQLNCSQERMRPGRSIEQGIVCSADNVQQLRIWVLCMQCALVQHAVCSCAL